MGVLLGGGEQGANKEPGMRFAAVCATALLLASCGKPREPFAVFKQVHDFQLTADTGQPFESAKELKGKVWLADFIYSSCPGPCPRMSSQMAQVQKAIQGLQDARLVSFTVDPKRDTPEKLSAYAGYYGAQPGRWFFLTGGREVLEKLSLEAFQLSRITDQLDHSTRFALVDRQGRVRKYYMTTEGFNAGEIAGDMKALLEEQGS